MRVGIPQAEIEDLPVEVGPEADAVNLEFLEETLGDALDHAVDDGAGGAPHGVGEAGGVDRLDHDLAVLFLDGDRRG